MDNNKNITAGELGKKLESFEHEISPWAKAGMRAYTPDELIAYEASITLIDFLESKSLIDGKKLRAYWTLRSPTQHMTIRELKPFDAGGDELEVFEKVLNKILHGDGDMDDFNFIREVEKRTGLDILNADLRARTISTMVQLKEIKEAIANLNES